MKNRTLIKNETEAKNLKTGNIVKLPNNDWAKVFNVGNPEGSGDSVNGYDINL